MTARLVVASNRGPVAFDEDGTSRRGVGGLVSVLTGALAGRDATWVAAAIGDADRAHAGFLAGEGVRLLDIPNEVYDPYYNRLANRVLWFVHHYLFDPPRTPVFDEEDLRAWDAFAEVNSRFAEAVDEEAAGSAVAAVQDYHLSLVPPLLRKRRGDLRIAHFWHIPFAQPDYLRLLPDAWSRALLEGLLAADLVGFQTARWAGAFAACCRDVLGARTAGRRVAWGGRTTSIGVYPVGVNPDHMKEEARRPEVRRERAALSSWLGDRALVLRVDRTELSKNILRGLLAFESVLERRGDLRGRVVHLALLTPSRRDVPEYRAYVDDCLREAARINDRFGPETILCEIADNFPRVLAAYALYDVLVVNPVIDGMNLVAREGPVLNRRDGALVLSRNAGAWAELGAAALGVNPFDVASTSAALEEAIDMPASERAERARRLKRLARGRSPGRWLEAQLRDLER
jgi:trehalose 6-phosphate synthase